MKHKNNIFVMARTSNGKSRKNGWLSKSIMKRGSSLPLFPNIFLFFFSLPKIDLKRFLDLEIVGALFYTGFFRQT